MKVKCFVIDDENYAVEFLSRFIERTPELQLVGSSTDPVEALERILSGEVSPDIIFLDIDMPKLNGMDFATLVSHLTNVVLVTGDTSFSLQAYELGVVDYLVKPVSYMRFESCINRIKSKMLRRSEILTAIDGKLALKHGLNNAITYIDFKDIVYVEASSNYSIVHTKPKSSIKTLVGLSDMEEQLGKGFMRIHRSYVINLSKISKFFGNTVVLSDNIEVPLGRNYRDAFLKVIHKRNS